MKTLATLHRWAGGLAGLLLAILALSGTILLWEDYWITLPGSDDPFLRDPAAISASIAAAAEIGDLSRITFASENFGLHQATYTDGSGAYLTQNAKIVERWNNDWGRTELWLFDLHHYLLVGEVGEIVVGVLGLLLVFFTISGAILWWRTRKTFKFKLFPARMTRSAIIRQHRDLGVVITPLLLLLGVTGAFMIFPSISNLLLSPWAQTKQAPPSLSSSAPLQGEPDWQAMVENSLEVFPGAAPRRLQIPSEAGKPYAMRLKQAFEWTPNGRSYVYLDPANAQIVGSNDPAIGDMAQAIQEKYYPLHAGKVGGLIWKLALSFGGFCLILLGSLAVWSFWLLGKKRHAKISQKTAPPSA